MSAVTIYRKIGNLTFKSPAKIPTASWKMATV